MLALAWLCHSSKAEGLVSWRWLQLTGPAVGRLLVGRGSLLHNGTAHYHQAENRT